jgi:hypothetical protein
MVSVPITLGAEFRYGQPLTLFESRYETIDGARNYDVAGAKPSFVAVRSEGMIEARQFNVVLNWFNELKARR